MERDDNAVEEVLDPYFDGSRYQLGYREALDDDVIAHFKIAFVGRPFEGPNSSAYEQQTRRRARTGASGLTNTV